MGWTERRDGWRDEEVAAAYDARRFRTPLQRAKHANDARIVARLLGSVGAGLRVLDAPTGTGRMVPELLAEGHRVVGIDLSTAMLSRAAGGDAETGFVGHAAGEIERLPFASDAFDAAISLRFLFHARDRAVRSACTAARSRRARPRGSRAAAGTLKHGGRWLRSHVAKAPARTQRAITAAGARGAGAGRVRTRQPGLRKALFLAPRLTRPGPGSRSAQRSAAPPPCRLRTTAAATAVLSSSRRASSAAAPAWTRQRSGVPAEDLHARGEPGEVAGAAREAARAARAVEVDHLSRPSRPSRRLDAGSRWTKPVARRTTAAANRAAARRPAASLVEGDAVDELHHEDVGGRRSSDPQSEDRGGGDTRFVEDPEAAARAGGCGEPGRGGAARRRPSLRATSTPSASTRAIPRGCDPEAAARAPSSARSAQASSTAARAPGPSDRAAGYHSTRAALTPSLAPRCASCS